MTAAESGFLVRALCLMFVVAPSLLNPHFILGLCPLIFPIIMLCHPVCFVSTLETYNAVGFCYCHWCAHCALLAYGRFARMVIAVGIHHLQNDPLSWLLSQMSSHG
jgi:hypothetical protein